ncbi:hypothetical protein BRAO375_1450032 [Bradyrhizobium sp. ORS 375]|uniref:hypothetical protein n=1 Tax=Bradyrhizobium sp. (strain ORS 375) TaxID=566679 RepID=UPI00024068C7|nr:hypothetical protein [Bradyrhizobium sp. ORS 375]CCD91310.1 hypothetical protein BRAO375_1450032 [Bradyrhizobium sp. ORS 375]
MKQLLEQFAEELMQDDLLVPVACGLCGAVLTPIGLLLLYGFTTRGIERLPLPWPLAALTVLVLLSLGPLLILRSVLSRRTKLGSFAERYATLGFLRQPDDFAVGIMLPAIALTLLLRRLGVNGEALAD